MYTKRTIKGLHHPSFKSWNLPKKIGSPQWPIAQYEFRLRKISELEIEFKKKWNKLNKGPNGVDCRTKPEDKNLTLLSL
jgi:hypothetical protein